MVDDWVVLESVNVLSNHRINLIESLAKISFEHAFEGECVRWHIDRDQNVAVIADSSLSDQRYIELKKTAVMDPGGQIRPPKSVREEVSGYIEPDNTVYYLSSEGMMESPPYSSYVLTSEKMFSILDGESELSTEVG